jgi:16S rRNA (adenine(1408)-N(1))-methyltransferase
LLHGVLGRDAVALCGVAAVARPGAAIVVLASVLPSDGVPGVDCLDETMRERIADAWYAVGLELSELRPATRAELGASGSTWARRLGPERPVWRLAGVRSANRRAG